jgi:hypothetical protein
MPALRSLLEALTPAVEALTGEVGLDAEVSEVVLVGPGDQLPDAPTALLVVTDAHCLLDRPVRAAGVVLKLPASERAAWRTRDHAVLVADDELPWNHLLQLLATAAATGPRSSDLFALANAIAGMVGGAVAIEDPRRRVLAYSSLPDQPIDEARTQGILGRQVPDLAGNDSLYRQLQRAPGVVRFPATGAVLPRMAVAVRSGAELLGSLWVVEAQPLGAAAEQALLDSARLAALHLLRARAGHDVERRARGELLRGLLDGRSAPDLVAARLGIDPLATVTVLGFALPDEAADELEADALADLAHVQSSAVSQDASVLVQARTLYVLLPVPGLPRQRLLQLAAAVVERARTARHLELAGAVGATVAGLSQVMRSRADVDAVLRLVEPGSVAAIEDLLPQVVLLDLRAHLAASPHLRLPELEALLAYDAEHGTPYAQSVRAYLAANADVPLAAEAVSVHANTFRYRMRRVRELFGLDLDDPDVRLVAWLQLRTRA